MFKTLDESIAKEKPAVRTRIIAGGDKLAAERDAAAKAVNGGALPLPATPKKAEPPRQP